MRSTSRGAPASEPEHGWARPRGVLVIVPPRAGDDHVAPTARVAGLPLLRRTVLAATRAGFKKILLHPGAVPEDRTLLAGTAAAPLASTELDAPSQRTRVVLLATHVLPQTTWLRALLEAPLEAERLYTDGAALLIDTENPRRILAEAEQTPSAAELLESLRGTSPPVARVGGNDGRLVLTTQEAVPRAETWLLRGLVRETEGFMSRHVERRISLTITRRLAGTRITPNVMTLVSLAVGLLGAPFFLSQAAAYQLPGALLLLAHSILDGCDGELARLKFQESHWGSVLDFWGDNVVHVAVMACIAIGWGLAARAAWPLAVGAVVVVSVLGTAAFVYRHTTKAGSVAGTLFPPGSGQQAWLPRFVDVLARRDFIYLVVLLSAFGKATWFLVLAAVGTPLFFLALVLIARAEARRLERPL